MLSQSLARNPGAPQDRCAAAALQPGELFGPFRLGAKLGQGVTGVVFAAHDERHGRAVALKIQRSPSDPMMMRRFLREGRLGMTVRHPNLVEVVELVQAPGRCLLVMELVRGETLHVKLQAAGGQSLPLETALRIARRLCRGLARAHAAGVVHRDIKPANIMISETGEVKLLDFGIAKVPCHEAPWQANEDAEGNGPLSVRGAVIGTPAYMAPEQARGNEVDARADVFSVGVILYQMLTGRKPFQGATALDLLLATERDRPPPPCSPYSPYPASLKLAINHAVLRCLDKLPSRRFADAQRLLDELRALPAPTPAKPTRGALGQSSLFFSSRSILK